MLESCISTKDLTLNETHEFHINLHFILKQSNW